ncbi:hypothetical protein [Burkholderia cepacia]|uniref:hypothetical protein n=1 Tax=Burkholderia cepacia TaxID=292 RepID=UPI002AB6F110|nr:hypothetical protein [Burkholderia cepacia]
MDSAYARVDGVLLDGLQFCARVYELFETVWRHPDSATRLRLRPSTFEKRLIEELLPICRYLQSHYRTGRYISICWSSGNQRPDATMEQRGGYIDHGYYPAAGYLEVTSAAHENDHLLRERLDTVGFAYGVDGLSVSGTRRRGNREIASEVVVHGNEDFVHAMGDVVLKSILGKVEKVYPEHTVLIVRCVLNSLYYPDEWDRLVALVRGRLPQHQFDEIWMCDDSDRFHDSLDCRPLKRP